jgi:hypothetical protein
MDNTVVSKRIRSLPIGVADEDIDAVEAIRSHFLLSPSRSKVACVLLRWAIRRVIEGEARLEVIAVEFSDASFTSEDLKKLRSLSRVVAAPARPAGYAV